MISVRRFLPSLAQAAATLTLAVIAAGAKAQTKWNLPSAYAATNHHTENLVQLANDVDKATDGKPKITVHANASLFKANEIKRAVQGGQAQIGGVLLVNFENENPIYAGRRHSIPGDELRRIEQARRSAEALAVESAGGAGNHAAVRGAVAAAKVLMVALLYGFPQLVTFLPDQMRH